MCVQRDVGHLRKRVVRCLAVQHAFGFLTPMELLPVDDPTLSKGEVLCRQCRNQWPNAVPRSNMDMDMHAPLALAEVAGWVGRD